MSFEKIRFDDYLWKIDKQFLQNRCNMEKVHAVALWVLTLLSDVAG
jgi:hypothetical protein